MGRVIVGAVIGAVIGGVSSTYNGSAPDMGYWEY